MEGKKKNISAKRKKGSRPKQIQIDSSYKLVEARARVHNEFCATHNKLVSPLLRDIREKQLTGKLTSDILASYKKKMLVARQKLEESHQQILLKYEIGKIQNETLANAIPMHIDTARWLERLPDWYLNKLEERQAQPGQPGALVQGVGHPCCLWFARSETRDWPYKYGPTLDPYNPALSQFYYNWLTPSRVQLKFGIKGTKDDEYTDYYQSHIIFTTNYSPSRRGRIRFQVNAKFVNAYLLVAGTYDWFSSNDYGWAGAYYKITVDHSAPSGGREMLFNTWNGNPSSTYYHTMYENLVEAEADSESNLFGVNVRTPFWPNVIPNLSRNINSNNNGGPIVMNVGDTIQISTEFLFDAQAYGDESAEGFVNIKDWLGEQGYLEMEPLVVLLEECAD